MKKQNTNDVHITGRITKNPDYSVCSIKQKPSSRAFFDICCNYLRGRKLTTPWFFHCVAFGEMADKVQTLKKGESVFISGYLMHFVYKSPKTGQTYNNVQIVIEDCMAAHTPNETEALDKELEKAEELY